MWKTILQLTRLSISGFLRRIRYQILRESSIFLSMIIFMSLIRYISQDFLNKIFEHISIQTYQQAKDLWVASVIFLTSWVLRIGFTKKTISDFARSYATPRYALLIFQCIEAYLIPLFLLTLVIAALGIHTNQNKNFYWVPIIALFILYLPLPTNAIRSFPFKASVSPLFTQIRWRLSQLLRIEPLQIVLTGLLCTYPWLLENQLRFYQKALWVWVFGFGLSLVIVKGMSQALKHSDLEKTAGLSHDMWLKSFEVSILLITTLPFACVFWITNNISLALLTAAIPWLVPWVLLQLDGKRPALVIPSLWLCSIFWSTAIIAHPACILLALPIRAFGYQSQQDRFYGE